MYALHSGKVVANCNNSDLNNDLNNDLNFAEEFSKLTNYDFILPQVIQLSSQLKKLGVVPQNNKDPRDLRDLNKLIEAMIAITPL
ncbi:MAG: hypothetical protein HQK51_19295 [Oligoflexia bacterium]|nr:hypothetical protein [Oligoflexia bacterium]